MKDKPLMKSRKNLTRFTYETAAFEGWRLCVSRAGTTFTKYFSDKSHGDAERSLRAAEIVLNQIITLTGGARRINGKLSKSTISKVAKILKSV